MDQGLHKFVEFCTCLETCEPSEGGSKGEKPSKLKTAGKRKAKDPQYRAKCAKANTSHNKVDKVNYKDLNAFVNAKITTALKKAEKSQ
eukprot:611052-Ditylum_brightwellii.AAC.1